MAMARKKAAGRKVAKTAKAKSRARTRNAASKTRIAARPAKKSARSMKKSAPKKAVKATAKRKASVSKVKAKTPLRRPVPKTKSGAMVKVASAAPVKPGIAARPRVRDVNAGVQIDATILERVSQSPRPAAVPLKLPFAMPLERPVAPLELRPAPRFERVLLTHDDE